MITEDDEAIIKSIISKYLAEVKNKQDRHDVSIENKTGLYTAVVVSTLDPLQKGGVRWYNPLIEPGTPADACPFAYPIANLGGFDDSGGVWVPPAGSRIAIMFQDGDIDHAFYFGTIWDGHRGSDTLSSSPSNHLDYWGGEPIPEYDCLWSGRRNGYLFGDNTGDQVDPPWNNESYNSYDADSTTDFYTNTQQFNSISLPNIKEMKTEQKHYIKFVDGDPLCNLRWKRMEMASSRGNIIMFKDDHLHPAGQWAFGGDTESAIAQCHTPITNNPYDDVTTDELPCCAGDNGDNINFSCFPPDCQPNVCPDASTTDPSVDQTTKFANPFYKRQEEMRVYQSRLPSPFQDNSCNLDQSGIFMQSLSGHEFVCDDKVNQPTGVPSWDRDFDFGCDDVYLGKMFMRSATGHFVGCNDTEDVSQVRGMNNGICAKTATGNFFEMNDSTLNDDECASGNSTAGCRRGFTMQSTSTHLFQMNDSGLQQASPVRASIDQATTSDTGPHQADQPGFTGYCLLRSGYGLQLLMKDEDRQDQTANQYIQLLAPQTDNTERGAHMLVLQEQATGPGYVILRAGGVLYHSSYDDSIEVVGEDNNPANKFSTITDNYIIDTTNMYFNHNCMALHLSEQYIFLLAGRDCGTPDESDVQQATASQCSSLCAAQSKPGTVCGQSDAQPCGYNAIVAKDPWVCPYTGYVHYGVLTNKSGPVLDSRSNRVFISAGGTGVNDGSSENSGDGGSSPPVSGS